jgi:hypothetical protein
MLPTLTKRVRHRELLKTATIREFSGGWNVLDDDLNLSVKYAPKLYNMYYGVEGDLRVRYGTELFVATRVALSDSAILINAEYFGEFIIAVYSNGEIVKIGANKTVERIWDQNIAAALPDAPAGWSETSFASFAQFNGELIICNGVDKPLIVHANYSVEYLHDVATGSNLNVPIARYVVACNRFLCMAGDPVNPNRIHISARDTSGTWYGDPPPNDGTYIDVGSVIPNGNIIRGITPFRDKLIVGYAEGAIIGSLGIYSDEAHTPNFDDGVPEYGSISHRGFINYGDDVLFMDRVGVSSLKRTTFSGTIRPERVSDLVDPEIASELNPYAYEVLEDRVFSVFNQREGQFMFFVPNAATIEDTTETKCFVFNYRPSLDVASWSRFDGWNWTCAVRTGQGNIFFGDKAGNFYIYGSRDNEITCDFQDDVTVNGGEGAPITFTWELPWMDFNRRAKSKTTKYISFDTRGLARFTCKMYVDRYTTSYGGADAPALSAEFVGGDTNGFGNSSQPYGGGRDTSNDLLFAWPSKFNLAKLVFTGDAAGGLSFVSITLHYLEGGINR